jgi:hypothetical protein
VNGLQLTIAGALCGGEGGGLAIRFNMPTHSGAGGSACGGRVRGEAWLGRRCVDDGRYSTIQKQVCALPGKLPSCIADIILIWHSVVQGGWGSGAHMALD